jgi:hypothetical protein
MVAEHDWPDQILSSSQASAFEIGYPLHLSSCYCMDAGS